MHTVSIAGIERPVADEWNALQRRQLLDVARLLHQHHRNHYDLRMRLLCVLLGIRLPFLLSFTTEQIVQVLWLTDFVLDGITLTRQLLDQIRVPGLHALVGRGRLYGPRDSLRNVTFLEFVFADSYFLRFRSTDEAMLNKLVAVLYRPQRRRYRPSAEDFGGDRRAPFNENHLERRAAQVATISLDVRLAVVTWYAGCRRQLEQMYPLVFEPARQEDATDKGWDYVLREMSGTTFGNLQQTGQQLLHDVLAKMQDDGEVAQKLRAEAEKQRNR